jgi:hypothetical protein
MLNVEGVEKAAFQTTAVRSFIVENWALKIFLEDDEIVPMNDFLVFLWTESLLDLGRFEPLDPCQGVGREVYESFGKLFAILVEAADRISRIERTADVKNT